jgi:hypothetical protein
MAIASWNPAGHCGAAERLRRPCSLVKSTCRNGNSHRTLIAPADRRDGYCLIVLLQKIGLAIVNTVQFSTHCGQI